MSEEVEEKVVNINLDDQIILSTDKDGNELLRLAIKCGDKEIKVRFPTLGSWDGYIIDVSKLFLTLSQHAGNLDYPEELTKELSDKDKHATWLALYSVATKAKQVSKQISNIFFKYLRPEIDGIKDAKSYIIDNLGVDQTIRLFTSIALIDEWVKKNTKYILGKMHPHLPALQPCFPGSEKNGDSAPVKPIKVASSTFVNF